MRGVPPGCLRFEPTSCNPGQSRERRERRERVSGNPDRVPLQIGGVRFEKKGKCQERKKRGPGGEGGGIQTPKFSLSPVTQSEREATMCVKLGTQFEKRRR